MSKPSMGRWGTIFQSCQVGNRPGAPPKVANADLRVFLEFFIQKTRIYVLFPLTNAISWCFLHANSFPLSLKQELKNVILASFPAF